MNAQSDADDWGPISRYFPGWAQRLTVVPQDEAMLDGWSPGPAGHLVAADGRVWKNVRKDLELPFLERVLRTGSPLYICQPPCPDVAQVSADATWDSWLAHRARLMDGVGVVDSAGEWREDERKDLQAIMFVDKQTKHRVVLLEFGYC